MELNIELFNRIRREVDASIFFGDRYWPEVCRLYAEEVNKMDFKTQIETDQPLIEIQKKEISQLKKQLADKQSNLHEAFSVIEDLKSKLEVKEKPDFEGLWDGTPLNTNAQRRVEGFVSGCERVWNDFVIPRDATISDLQAQNKSLLDKIAELEKDIAERLDSMDRFDKAEKQWSERSSNLESELKEAKELLDESIGYFDYTPSSKDKIEEIKDFIKDKR